MRGRNFSRRVIFFLSANSTCEKLVWWVLPTRLDYHTRQVSLKNQNPKIKSAFPLAVTDHTNRSEPFSGRQG